MKWNYVSKEKRSTGYEDLYDILKTYSGEAYKQASPKRKSEMIDEVVKIYEDRNIFPIVYLNDEGIREEIQKGIDFEPKIENDVVNTGMGICTDLCNFFMPCMFDAYSINGRGSAEFKFHDNNSLRFVVKFALQCDGSAMPKSVMAGLRQVGSIPSNFRPMNAQALYEAYCPEGGVIHDYSAGYGGRLVGALTSKKNFSYIATEPNSETYENLYKLGNAVESVTGRKNSFKIIKQGSEVFRSNPEIFDFSFSSPPYFALEVYSNEPTQCYIKYPNIYDWFDNYVKSTIDNIYYMLKHDRYYAVNIADFNYGSKVMNYVDSWKDLSVKAGFKYIKDLQLRIPKRACINQKNASEGKRERIMLFYKE